MEEKQKQTHPEVGEDATQYGEFISSYFAWVPLPKQKEKAEELAEMTKKGPTPNLPGQKKDRHQIYLDKKRTDPKLPGGKQ